MSYLVADIGNTITKLGLFAEDQLKADEYIETKKLTGHKWLDIKKWHAYKAVAVSNVSTYKNILRNHKQKFQVSASIPLPIGILYKSAETLGADRIADVCGALTEFRKTDVLIIDLGTCITVDILTKDAKHNGGTIFPGIEIQYRALHEFTGQLPLISHKNQDFKFPGLSTQECMQAGVLQGTMWHLESLLAWFGNNYPTGKAIFTGGNASFFVQRLKSNIFARPKLSLYGLWEILKYNLSNIEK